MTVAHRPARSRTAPLGRHRERPTPTARPTDVGADPIAARVATNTWKGLYTQVSYGRMRRTKMASTDAETQTGTEAERPNDVTIFYAALGDLGRRTKEHTDLREAAVGAKVTGEGSTGSFTDGYWDGEEDVTVSKTFTITMDCPAWKVQKMIEDLESFAGGRTTVDLRMSGSVPGRPPKYTDSGIAIPRGTSREYTEEEVDHRAVVTATADVTGFMAGTGASEEEGN